MAGEASKKADQRQTIRFQFDDMSNLNEGTRMDASREKVKVVSRLFEILRKRFEDFECGVYPYWMYFDQKRWTDEKEFENESISKCTSHFATALSFTVYYKAKVLVEGKMLTRYVSIWIKRAETVDILKHILTYKRTEFPNVCFFWK